MVLFDQLISDTEGLLPEKRKVWKYHSDRLWPQTKENEIIMMRETAFELGGSGKPSVNYTCVTSDESKVPEDEILLFGPDLCSIKSNTPFARIAFLQVEEMNTDEEAHKAIRNLEYMKYHIFPKGYMIRASSMNYREQVRIGKREIKEGISFETIGNTFIESYKRNPLVKHVRLIFVTEQLPAFSKLVEYAGKSEGIIKALDHIMDGLDTDCQHCDMKIICDEVEGMREMHFKKAGLI